MVRLNECLGPRYMEGFRCIGSACEEDCCHGWHITIDQQTHGRIKQALDGCKIDRERFRQSFKRNRKDNKNFSNYAALRLKADGNCPFLESNGLCYIHRRFGEGCLSLTCTTYPRRLNRVGGRWELSATLSCPETARRCLLQEDATELVALDPERVNGQRLSIMSSLPANSDDPYLAYRDLVREVVLQMLAARDYPLTSRLFFLAFFAQRIAPFHHRKSRSFTTEALASAIDCFADPESLAELHGRFQEMTPPIDLPMSIIQVVLLSKLPSSGGSFRQLLAQVWATYVGPDDAGRVLDLEKTQDQTLVNCSELAGKYLQRRAVLVERFGARLDLYLENYCRNYWFGEGFEQSANLLQHLQKLLVRLAVLRFLLISHPELDPLLAPSPSQPPSQPELQQLDQLAVKVCYQFSRGLEHGAPFLAKIQQTLVDQGMQEVAHLALLIKV